MNEQIQKLAKEAGAMFDHMTWVERDLAPVFNKFAELIIEETIMQMAIQMDKFGDDQSNNPTWYKSEEAVRKHFGVEE